MRVGALEVHSFWQWLQVTIGFVFPLGRVVTSDHIGSLPTKPGREPFGGIRIVYTRLWWCVCVFICGRKERVGRFRLR